MRVAVVGSRRRTDREAVAATVRDLDAGTVVVSGGCEGPDVWAADAAREHGLVVMEHLPALDGCRQRFEFTRAYHARNQAVVDGCDRLVAFVSLDRKGGTEDTIRRAIKAGKPVELK